MVQISFTKATGAGNDFVILDECASSLGLDPASLARALCDRHFGVGADGLIVLLPGDGVDFEMRYYNADGSTGGMCGNGGRCAVRYAHERGLIGAQATFRALDHLYHAEVTPEKVRLSMKDPHLIRAEQVLLVGGSSYRGHLLDTGAPHLVVFTEEVDLLDVVSVGRVLRHHSDLAPEGANINFVALDANDAISLRTYERGVEDETLACGTGSVASAVAAVLFRGLQSPVSVRVRSGELLRVELERRADRVTAVALEGSARVVFSGSCHYDPASGMVLAQVADL